MPWDMGFVAEALRRRLHGLDEEAIKAYFPLPRVLAGVRSLIERLYGVRLVPRDGVSVWEPSVIYYDLVGASGVPFAGVYLDLHARSGKRGGAWMDVCRPRFRDADRTHTPVAYLTCNFAPPTLDRPALLSHNDVLTLLHEFGHVLHHVLTEVDLPSIGGISSVEWDAVELPSQFMENFGWDKATLAAFSAHVDTGATLPDALYEKMLGARRFPGRTVPPAPDRVRDLRPPAAPRFRSRGRRARGGDAGVGPGSGLGDAAAGMVALRQRVSGMCSRVAMPRAITATCGRNCCRRMRSRGSPRRDRQRATRSAAKSCPGVRAGRRRRASRRIGAERPSPTRCCGITGWRRSGSPSPFAAVNGCSLSRREREGAAKPRKGEGDACLSPLPHGRQHCVRQVRPTDQQIRQQRMMAIIH